MKKFKLSLPVIACLLMTAHFSRVSNDVLAATCLLLPFILLSKREWVMRVFQLLLVFGGMIWIERAVFLLRLRQQNQMPWIRLVVILGVVALFTILSALVFKNKKIRGIFSRGTPGAVLPPVMAFLVTVVLLSFLQLKVKFPVMLLAERFVPGAGWAEILLLGFYAGWITEKMCEPNKVPLIRRRIWTIFSVVFFSQLLLGLLGVEKLLMTGKLHLPVPALIIAGPLFRGDGFFMLFLLGGAILLAGPAWCSYLCYIGAWDNLAAQSSRQPRTLPSGYSRVRVGILVVVVFSALVLRYSGLPPLAATISAAVFGLMGVGLMLIYSRRTGVMTHCIAYCPIGLVADFLGRISPFRVGITPGCTGCGSCSRYCRYHALLPHHIQRKKPGITCTLCGDCLTSCNEHALQYKFLGLKSGQARTFFIVLVVSLHAVFLAVARL